MGTRLAFIVTLVFLQRNVRSHVKLHMMSDTPGLNQCIQGFDRKNLSDLTEGFFLLFSYQYVIS